MPFPLPWYVAGPLIGLTMPLQLMLALFVVVGAQSSPSAQSSFTATQLAEYPLTVAAFTKFAHATRLMIAATRDEPRFVDRPLFSKAIFVSGDAPEMAAALQQRLDSDPLLATALFAADMSARDYTKFALTLVAARLAQGFLNSGVMRGVPAGVAESNVRFIGAHEKDVAALLKEMRLEM
jgi:hypothetical protein